MKTHNEFCVEEVTIDKGRIAEQIMRELPQWFGIDSAIIQYRQDVELLPTYVAKLTSGENIGFLALKFHNIYSAEIYVMGVLPKFHRQHIGSALIIYAQDVAYQNGCEYLAVKTLGPSLTNEHYEGTRLFYFKQGFRPIEELHSIWANNPCLLMVKRIL